MSDLDKIKNMIVELTGISRVTIQQSSNLREDLGLDSLNEVELVMEVENEFGISITDEEAEKLKTVNDILTFVEAHQA